MANDHLPQLFRTQSYGPGNVTHVYWSTDPLDFGPGDTHYVTSLPVAAPELVRDGTQDYILALNPNLNGIRIARLRWQE